MHAGAPARMGPMLRPSFIDARGQRRPLVGAISMARSKRPGLGYLQRHRIESGRDVPPDMQRRILRRAIIAMIAVMLPYTVASPLIQQFLPVKGLAALAVLLPASMLAGIAGPAVFIRVLRGGAAASIAAAYAAAGYCGSCGYALERGFIAEDGCTVCPECGAAWRLEVAAEPATAGSPGPSPRVDPAPPPGSAAAGRS
jgi:hypothetical protein